MSADTIKKFCAVLQAHSITRIEANYDGCGDSGDLTLSFISETSRRSRGHDPTPITIRHNEKDMRRQLIDGPQPLTTAEDFDNFVDELWSLLPGGWEIDDGSFGDISVNVIERTIAVEHNERYTEVRTENFTY